MNTQTLVPERAHDTEVSLPALFVVLALSRLAIDRLSLRRSDLRDICRSLLERGAFGRECYSANFRGDVAEGFLSCQRPVHCRIVQHDYWPITDLVTRARMARSKRGMRSSNVTPR